MPKYEYACKSCSERLEVVQSFADGPLTECPACGGHLRKVFSPPSIAFKGSGFYRTDNRKRRANSEQPVKADSESSSSDGGKAEPAKAESGKAETATAAPAAESKPKAAEAKTA